MALGIKASWPQKATEAARPPQKNAERSPALLGEKITKY